MPAGESPLEELAGFLPPGTYERVADHIIRHRVHLTVKRARASVLGDYRHSGPGRNHRISVNGNLNPYAFLITLLHELAHLFTFERYGNRVAPHGREWKSVYAAILADFISQGVFPEDIRQALSRTLENPAASTCADDSLMRVLRRYDTGDAGTRLVEDLQPGERFRIRGGRVFVRGDRVRKRIRCTEEATGRIYLFSPIYEVSVV
jgi:SprT protein